MKGPVLRIIPLTKSHFAACNEIVSASEPWKTLGEKLDFAPLLAEDGAQQAAYVCVRELGIAGFIIFSPEAVFARGGYIRALAVAPDARRRGIGGKLLSFAEGIIARRTSNVYLCVSSFNRRGQAFYRSLGYQRVGKIPGLILPDTSEYIYWKQLS